MSSNLNPRYFYNSRPTYDRVYHGERSCPEVKLWSIVLLVFMADVQNDYLEYKNSLNGIKLGLRKKLESHRYHSRSSHVAMICSFASIDHTAFIEKIEKISEGKVTVDIKGYKY